MAVQNHGAREMAFVVMVTLFLYVVFTGNRSMWGFIIHVNDSASLTTLLLAVLLLTADGEPNPGSPASCSFINVLMFALLPRDYG